MNRDASETVPLNPKSSGRPAGPTDVPGFDLLEEVGGGGMGTVWRARDLDLHRDVAIKVLNDDYPPDSFPAQRFLEEARITSQLQHPGIPAIYRIGTRGDGQPYLAMKLIKGRTLNEILKRREPINIMAVFEAMAQAVGYAHSRGVIHRDLKPHNVMVGAFGEVQIMDWGLAKHLASEEKRPSDSSLFPVTQIHARLNTDSAETLHGSVLGTPAYMPPEQAAGDLARVDERSDVFGLGAVLCQMLTGEAPFSGKSIEAVRQNAMFGKMESASAKLDSCDAEPELVALCRKCLSRSPKDRPANGGELAQHVAALRATAVVRALSAEAKEHRAEERRRGQLSLGIGLLATILIGAGLVGWKWIEARREGDRARQALVDLAAEQQKTQLALAQVTSEQHKTQDALKRVTAEDERLKKAQARTFAALDAVTDDVVEKLYSRQSKLTATDREFLGKVIKLLEEAVADQKGDAEARRQQSLMLQRVAAVQQKLGDFKSAEANYVASRDLRQRAVNEKPDSVELIFELAASRNNLGNHYRATRRQAAAEGEIRAARELFDRLVRLEPENELFLLNLSHTQGNLGGLALAEGRLDEAERELIACRDIERKLAAKQPKSAEYRQCLVMSHRSIATLLDRQGKPAEAEKSLLEGLKLSEELVAQHPGVADYRRELGLFRSAFGQRRLAAGQVDEADAEFAKAVSHYRKIVADEPAIAKHHNLLAGMLVNLAEARRRGGEPAQARDLLAEALPHHRVALSVDPRDPEFREYLVNNRRIHAVASMRLGDHAAVPAAAKAMAECANGPDEVAEAAQYLGRAITVAAKDEALSEAKRKDAEKAYAEAAMAYLQTAVAKGFKDADLLKSHADFAPLRPREDFKKLLAGLDAKKP